MALTIEARGLVKRFGRKTALDGLDLEVEPGKVVAVLGPNGAGKTTFVRAVATLSPPDGGILRVFGHDTRREADAVRRLIGLAGQFAAVEPAMTGRENLELIARLYGLRAREAKVNAAAILERFALAEDADRLVRTYSGGMRRKIDLGASLVGRPRLLLLDEPTTGLDPRSRIELWDSIDDLVDEGTDVLLTTQYLEEADRLANHLVIIDRGHAVASGAPAELKQRVGGNVLEIQVWDRADIPAVAAALGRLGGAEPQIDEPTRRISVGVGDGDRVEQLLAGLRVAEHDGVKLADVSVRQPKLDEVFLALTGANAERIGAGVGGAKATGDGSRR